MSQGRGRPQGLRNPDVDYESTEQWSFLHARRRDERDAEVPVPFCCPVVAGTRAAYPLSDPAYGKSPVWMSTYSVRGQTNYCEVRYCPHCGKRLPDFVLKKDPPPHLWQDQNGYCGNCGERNHACYCSHPESAWEVKDAPPVFAVTALIPRVNISDPDRPQSFREVLSVSRKTDHADLGWPGGKIDPGETEWEALVREVNEETGLHVVEAHLMFDAMDDVGVRCVTYRVTKYEGEIKTREAGKVGWIRPQALMTPASSFHRYNIALMRRVDPFGIFYR